jgi:hypothetical protein
MGGMFSCLLKDLKLQTAIGTCECAQSVCSCFANETEEAIIEKKIAEAIRIEIVAIGTQLRNAMHSKLEVYGDIPAIKILDEIMESPQPAENAVSIRIKSNEQAKYSLPDLAPPMWPDRAIPILKGEPINVSIKPMAIL